MMVEVLQANFESLLPEVEGAIKKATFIALDTEFTGLVANEDSMPSLFDSAAERYRKLCCSDMSKFIICQLGLSIFTKRKNDNSFAAQTYVFYLCPRSLGTLNTSFTWQASSLDFLCKFKFDFNKFAYDGISYLNEPNEKLIRRQLEKKVLLLDLYREVDELELQDQCSVVSAWLSTAKDGETFQVNITRGMNAYIMMNELWRRFSNISVVHHAQNMVVIEKIPKERCQELSHTRESLEERLVNSLLGFTQVFRILVDAKKPLIGHNMFRDLLLMYTQFYRPLPTSYAKFKKDINCLFPMLFDTKHICFSLRKKYEDGGVFSAHSLSELYIQLTTDQGRFLTLFAPHVQHLNQNSYKEQSLLHDAGYDAYITGFVFLRMAHFLASQVTGKAPNRPLVWQDNLLTLEPYCNRVNLIRAKENHVYFAGNDPPSSRPRWLVLQAKKNKILDPIQVVTLCSRYGNVDLKMVSPRAALLAVANLGCSKDILREFRDHPEFSVSWYNPLRHSPGIRAAFWSAFVASTGVGLYLLFKVGR